MQFLFLTVNNKCKKLPISYVEKLEFFMDVSPNWWLRARRDENFLKKYISKKFDSDYYPRIIICKGEKIDLDRGGQKIREMLLDKIKLGKFNYEFLPEDESLKQSYLISNGIVKFRGVIKKINARLLIKIKIQANNLFESK